MSQTTLTGPKFDDLPLDLIEFEKEGYAVESLTADLGISEMQSYNSYCPWTTCPRPCGC